MIIFKSFLLFLIIFTFNVNSVLSTCPSSFFDCGNDRCIAQFWRCDGDDDCGNWADEHSCHNPFELKTQIKECPVNHSHCNDTHDTCIPNKWLCDGMEDCANGSDEKNCTIASAQCVGYLCDSFECIPSRWRCDGIPDCEDSSDEHNCPKAKTNEMCDKEHGFYECLTGQCISHLKVCDNHKDCPQGDDEGTECRPTGCHSRNCSHFCFIAPEGPLCYCREGYIIDSDNMTCIDQNECHINKMSGLCSQICTNLEGGYKCGCHEGYQLVNNKSCIVKEGEPLLLFSNSEGIRGLWLQSGRYFPVYHSLRQTVGIDIYGAEDRVFWVDLDKSLSGVYSVGLTGEDFKPVVTTGLKSPEDLAIDWIGENVYITDAELNKIVVCGLDGEICSSELFGVVDLPRSIVVDPYQGIMFWSEWGNTPGIYESGMDGSNRTHLIKDQVIWPNGLAFDSMANRLYWTEAKYGRIEFYDLDTKNRKVVLQDKVFHPFALSVFEDSLYWSDWITFSLDTSHKFSGHNQTTIVKEVNEHIMGVHVYHPMTQKSSYNPCWLHMCSHLCVLAPSRQYACVCPDHLVLSSDNKTCIGKADNPFLLIGVGQEVKKLYPESIGNDVIMNLDIPKGIHISDIAFDWKTETLFVFDSKKLVIGSIEVDSKRIGGSYWTSLITTGLNKVEGLTYDSHTRNLYWLETREGILEVSTADGKARAVLLKDLDKPIDLALHSEHRRMYIAVMGSKPHIMVADMDGQNPKVLVASKDGLAVSLAIDKLHDKLFWADARNGMIEWMDLMAPKEESHKGVVKRDLGHVMSIAVHNKSLFYTDMDSNTLNHQTLGTEANRLSKIVLNVKHKGKAVKKLLVAVPEDYPIGPCIDSNGGCSHICLLGRFGATCKCPFGHTLEKDGQKCMKQNDMTDNSILCTDCVTSDYESSEELGFIALENSDDEDLNWFIGEDSEADILFSRHDSKHKVNESRNANANVNNDSSGHVKSEPIDVTTSRVSEVMTTKVLNKQTEDKQRNESKEFKVPVLDIINKIYPKNKSKDKSNDQSFKGETDNKSSNGKKGWLTMFITGLVVVVIVILVVIILKKDEYSEYRNVIYKRGDQLKGAIVNFQNPIFKRTFRRTEDEEPLNAETKSLNEEKY